MWVIQELIALNTIQQWTRKKFSERVDRLGTAFGLLKSLVRVARTELSERNKVRGRSSPAGFHAPQTLKVAAAVTKLHYCSPTVPLLEVKSNAAEIYKKQQ